MIRGKTYAIMLSGKKNKTRRRYNYSSHDNKLTFKKKIKQKAGRKYLKILTIEFGWYILDP